MEEPKPGEKYKDSRKEDEVYKIISIARDFNNPEKKFVIYRNLYETIDFPIGTIWSCSLEDFCNYYKGIKIKRFIKIEQK